MKRKLIEKFKQIFGSEGDIRTYFAPGRVNLIGEHTDYNGGHVFPCALTLGTYGAVRLREDHKLRFYSENMAKLGIIETSLEELEYSIESSWTNYLKGVIWTFKQKGYLIDKGFDILIWGNIPHASGLSSSASVEVLMGIILKDMYNLDKLSMIDIALFGQYAENNYNGVNCGIMDQFASAMGAKGQAIFLNTSDLSYEYAPIKLESMKIVIACSNKKRSLETSEYNCRRSQCDEALKNIQKIKMIGSLGELLESEFEQVKDYIKDPICRRRAKHAVYENQRTIQAVEALKINDIAAFGRLMNESHVSLKEDYEVTGLELDTLVETAWTVEGVIGSRMTGAGFGGCTVSIVKEDSIGEFIEVVGTKYKEVVGYAANFYVVEVGAGAGCYESE
jgi:galactokinase